MIQFDNLSKRYPGGFEALRNVSFKMDAGEMAFLTGHSGAGKSTLLKLLMLMERPTSGNLLINGKNLNRLSNSQIPMYRRQVGVVFQIYSPKKWNLGCIKRPHLSKEKIF